MIRKEGWRFDSQNDIWRFMAVSTFYTEIIISLRYFILFLFISVIILNLFFYNNNIIILNLNCIIFLIIWGRTISLYFIWKRKGVDWGPLPA